jgi:hypothetical protein
MAQVDPSIAMGYRPVQIESPVNQMAAIAQLRGMQEASQMNALKLQEYQQQQRERNALARIMSEPGVEFGSDAFMNRVLSEAPSMYEGIATRAAQRENLIAQREARKAETEKRQADLAKLNLGELKTAQKDIAGMSSLDEVKADVERRRAAKLLTDEHADFVLAGLPQDPAQFDTWKKRTLTNLLTAEKQLESMQPKPEKLELGGKIVIVDMNPNSATYKQVIREDVKTATPRQEQLLTPEEERQKIRIAAASRAPTAIPAPTVTMVLDPNDSTRMLSVDAKTYKGGSVNSPGVIGIAGKEPAGAKKQADKETAQENAGTILAQLRQSFDQLDKLNAITSTRNRPGTNIGAYLSSSPVGQFTGRVLGTEAQSERNKIAQTRPLLMTTIMQAMGLSAKQLDSNAELKLWLSAATDPDMSLEANREALNNLENLLTGKGKKEKAPAAAPAPKSDIRSKADAILGNP